MSNLVEEILPYVLSRKPPTKAQKRLERKLLAVGGREVFFFKPESDISRLIRCGFFIDPKDVPVEMRIGEPHRCHTNASELWAELLDAGNGELEWPIVTGYALSNGIWFPHTWVIQSRRGEIETLYETTNRAELYYGLMYERHQCFWFWFANYLQVKFPSMQPEEIPVKLRRFVAQMIDSI
jgi:hypothetical protein